MQSEECCTLDICQAGAAPVLHIVLVGAVSFAAGAPRRPVLWASQNLQISSFTVCHHRKITHTVSHARPGVCPLGCEMDCKHSCGRHCPVQQNCTAVTSGRARPWQNPVTRRPHDTIWCGLQARMGVLTIPGLAGHVHGCPQERGALLPQALLCNPCSIAEALAQRLEVVAELREVVRAAGVRTVGRYVVVKPEMHMVPSSSGDQSSTAGQMTP